MDLFREDFYRGANKPMNASSSEPTEPLDRSEVASSDAKSRKDECYIVLAQVNLLRIRKQTGEAIELCESALRRWPSRADAHALMGDLCSESGKLDDAIVRYCRSLEIEPKSRPMRIKLANVVREKRRTLRPAASEPKVVKGLRFDRAVRSIVLILATAMLATIVAAPVIFQDRQHAQVVAEDSDTVPRKINLSPIMLSPAALPAATTPDDANLPSPTSLICDPEEKALLDPMTTDKSLLQQGVQVLDAQDDPPTSGFAITFLYRPLAGGDSGKASILRNALLVAQSANQRFGAMDVRQITIRCLILEPSTQPSPASSALPTSGTTILDFVGTIERNAVPAQSADFTSLTTSQLLAYFTQTWWAPGA